MFTLSPTINGQAGVFPVVATISDGHNTATTGFNIIIAANQAPSFTGSYTDQTISVGSTLSITTSVPSYTDPESDACTYSYDLSSDPWFTVVSTSNGHFDLAPTLNT